MGAGTGSGNGAGTGLRARSRGRRVLLGGLAWAGAVVLTGTVAWNAVAVISDDSARPGLLAREQVSAALAEARSAATASPTAGPTQGSGSPTPGESSGSPTSPTSPTAEPGDEPTSPTSSPGTPASPSATAQPPAQATWVVAGGSVTAECTGSAIRLVAATPEDGWTVEVGSPGPEAVEVELHRSDAETHVRAVCSGGVPVQVSGRDTDKAEGSGHTSDD